MLSLFEILLSFVEVVYLKTSSLEVKCSDDHLFIFLQIFTFIAQNAQIRDQMMQLKRKILVEIDMIGD